jgi:hypothetical protein
MLSDWTAECGPEDPVLVVPWSDVSSDADQHDRPRAQFIDLRENPYDIDHLPEAAEHPALLQALRALNASRSPVFTAKCDAWPIAAASNPDDYANHELAYLRLNLAHADEETPNGFASYIDLLWRDRATFASRHRHEQLLDRITRRAAAIDAPYTMLELVLRPAFLDLTGPQEGFAVSLYVKSLGHDSESAYENWSRTLTELTTLVRSKAFAAA